MWESCFLKSPPVKWDQWKESYIMNHVDFWIKVYFFTFKLLLYYSLHCMMICVFWMLKIFIYYNKDIFHLQIALLWSTWLHSSRCCPWYAFHLIILVEYQCFFTSTYYVSCCWCLESQRIWFRFSVWDFKFDVVAAKQETLI